MKDLAFSINYDALNTSSSASTSNLRLTSSTSAKWFYIDLDTNLDGVHSSGEGVPVFGVYTHASDDNVYVRNKLGIGESELGDKLEKKQGNIKITQHNSGLLMTKYMVLY